MAVTSPPGLGRPRRLHRETTLYFLGIVYFCGIIGIFSMFFGVLSAASCLGATQYCNTTSDWADAIIGTIFVVSAFGLLLFLERFGFPPRPPPIYGYRSNEEVWAGAILLIFLALIFFFVLGGPLFLR